MDLHVNFTNFLCQQAIQSMDFLKLHLDLDLDLHWDLEMIDGNHKGDLGGCNNFSRKVAAKCNQDFET